MVYGELEQFPLEVQAKCRMQNVWFKLVNINYKFKFSNIMYKFLYEMYREENYKSPFLSTVETVLNGNGLSGMWNTQAVHQRGPDQDESRGGSQGQTAETRRQA